MSDFFDKAKQHFEQKRPFVIYKQPNSQKATGLFQNDSNLYTTLDFSEKGFVFCSFDGTSRILIPENKAESKQITLSEIPKSASKSSFISTTTTEAKEEFETRVQKAIATIATGELVKVVLSRFEVVALSDFDPIEMFSRLVHAHPAGYCYCWFHPKIGLWIGASPERLLYLEGKNYQTMALAGTQLATNEIVWKEKEIQEQKIVTNTLLEALASCSSSILVSEPVSVQAGNLVHIKTEIKGEIIEESDGKYLLDKLHPTPAISGFPKEKALNFIDENEGYDRMYYSGYFGEINRPTDSSNKLISDIYVNLRCMEIDYFSLNQAKIFVGCGIVKGSIPSKEWEETVNKSMTIKNSIL